MDLSMALCIFMAWVLVFSSCSDGGSSSPSCYTPFFFDVWPSGSVAWLRAEFLPSAVQGNAVDPVGVILSLGMDEAAAADYSFLDEHFGDDAGREFGKQAVHFRGSDVPSVLQRFVRTSSTAPNVLLASWHCVSETGDWCSRWSSFVAAFEKKGFFQWTGAATVFEWETNGSAKFCQEDEPKSPFKLERFSRTLVGSGSHRELLTEFSINAPETDDESSCSAVLVELLPNSLFADTFQLQRLTQRGRFKSAEVYGDTDLERPAVYSHQAILELRTSLTFDGSHLQAAVSTPLHARYVPLSSTSHHLVNLSIPLLLVACGDSNEQVIWGEIVKGVDPMIQWPVPAGKIDDAAVVTSSTALAAVVGTSILTAVTYGRRCPSKLC